jgi:SAM-dependent methyltransferase
MNRPRFYNWHYSHWLVHFISLRELKKVIPRYLRGITIDIGCGTKPYRDFITPFTQRYYGLEHPKTLNDKSLADVYAVAGSLPFKDRSVDTVFTTAVLEHLEEPLDAIREFARVLKQGGNVIATVPLFWHIHEEPRDYFRYTSYGLRHLFTKAGFEIEVLKAMSGFWVTFTQHFSHMVLRFHKGPMKLVPVLPLIAVVIQAAGFVLDKLDKSERWTWAYCLVARKSMEGLPALSRYGKAGG